MEIIDAALRIDAESNSHGPALLSVCIGMQMDYRTDDSSLLLSSCSTSFLHDQLMDHGLQLQMRLLVSELGFPMTEIDKAFRSQGFACDLRPLVQGLAQCTVSKIDADEGHLS